MHTDVPTAWGLPAGHPHLNDSGPPQLGAGGVEGINGSTTGPQPHFHPLQPLYQPYWFPLQPFWYPPQPYHPPQLQQPQPQQEVDEVQMVMFANRPRSFGTSLL